MKLALKILLIVLFLIAIFGLYIYSIVSKLKFDFEIKNINLQDFIIMQWNMIKYYTLVELQ